MEFDDNRFPLDEETIELMGDYRRQIAMIEQRMGGALDLFCRRHHLEGAWTLAPNLKEVMRPEEVPQPQ